MTRRIGGPYGMTLVVVVCALAVGRWWFAAAPALGQADALPTGWRDLPLATFVDQARKTLAAEPAPAADLVAAIHRHAAERLAQLSQPSGVVLDDLLDLYAWGRDELSSEQRVAVLPRLKPTATDVRSWDLAHVHRTCGRMTQLGLPASSPEAVVTAWLEKRPMDETLLAGLPADRAKQIGEVSWLCGALDAMGPAAEQFSVRWTGFIVAPSSGAYTFSTTPINVNAEDVAGHVAQVEVPGHADGHVAHLGDVSQRIAVWIDGQEVLKVDEVQWQSQQKPVTLAAGQRRALRVEFSYQRDDAPFDRIRPAIAQLLWQGPGIAKQLVPETALVPANGEGNGLSAEYIYAASGRSQTMTGHEARIDQTWHRGQSIVSTQAGFLRPALDLLWQLASDPQYLAACQAGTTRHALLVDDVDGVTSRAAILMSSAQQAGLARLIFQQPGLLTGASRDAVFRLYWATRASALDESIDLLGLWCRMHPMVAPQIGAIDTFVRENRLPYQLLADGVALQYPPHRQRLEERYLELPGGGCSLPVAYILGYAHFEAGELSAWISELDKRLADKALVGDARAGWLLARAQADELQGLVPQWRRSEFAVDLRYLAGRGWIETALLEAKSESIRWRAYQELIAGLAFQAPAVSQVRALLDAAAQRCPQSQAAIAAWRSQLMAVETIHLQARERQEAESQKAYLGILQRRHARAQQQGDGPATGRYERLLREAGSPL